MAILLKFKVSGKLIYQRHSLWLNRSSSNIVTMITGETSLISIRYSTDKVNPAWLKDLWQQDPYEPKDRFGPSLRYGEK